MNVRAFLSCLFFLSPQKHLMALTRFLGDVAAGHDSLDRCYIVMTRLIWERVDLGSAWVTMCDSFVWVSVESQLIGIYTIQFKWYKKLIPYSTVHTSAVNPTLDSLGLQNRILKMNFGGILRVWPADGSLAHKICLVAPRMYGKTVPNQEIVRHITICISSWWPYFTLRVLYRLMVQYVRILVSNFPKFAKNINKKDLMLCERHLGIVLQMYLYISKHANQLAPGLKTSPRGPKRQHSPGYPASCTANWANSEQQLAVLRQCYADPIC